MFLFSRSLSQKGRVGIELGANKISLSYVRDTEVEQCAYHFSDSKEERAAILKSFVQEHQLKGMRTSLVLAPRCYQILLTEMPDVEEAEVAEALPWKIKELLHYPLEELVLQHFFLPEDSFNRRQRMLYVIAVQKKQLNAFVDITEEAGLQVDSIDVPEMVLLRSILKRKDSQKNVAALYVDNTQGILCLGQQGMLYLSRAVDVGLEAFLSGLNARVDDSMSAQLPHETFLLELQRSLDYYEVQQGKGAVAEISCAPMGTETEMVQQFLDERLAPTVNIADIDSYCNGISQFGIEHQQHCFLSSAVARCWTDTHVFDKSKRGG